MLKVADLAAFGPPAELVQAWERHVQELTDVQEKAIRSGALDGTSNLLVVAPTSSGKTFIGELVATTSSYTKRRHSIFIVPFRALADEHYDLFKERYGQLLSVVISTSDWTEFDADIRSGSFNLAVMTYEKFAGFISHQPDLLQTCTTLVIDEVQYLGNETRGAELEMLITQVMLARHPPQLIALSASLDDINQLHVWLKANLIISSERPIPLTEFVCEPRGSAISLIDGQLTEIEQFSSPRADKDSLTLSLTTKLVAESKQVIIFRSTIKNVIETAKRLSSRLTAVGIPSEVETQLNQLEDSDTLPELRRCLASRVGIHNADMAHTERRLVEAAFQSGAVRALVTTTTLAMGVNLPCDVVVIADSSRFVRTGNNWTTQHILVSDYRNAAGRAGRLGKRVAGQSLLIAEHKIEQRQLVNAYLTGPVEPIQSQLPKRSLTDIVFSLVCSKNIDGIERIIDFITATFAYPTFYERSGNVEGLMDAIIKSIHELVGSGLVIEDEDHVFPTAVARALAGAGLSLGTCSRLSKFVEESMTAQLSTQDIVFEVASCVEIGDRPWIRLEHGREVDPRPRNSPDGSDSSPRSRLSSILRKPEITIEEMKQLLRARCLLEWMTGKSLREISSEFRGMGAAGSRVRDLGKTAAWLLESLSDAARARQAPDATQREIRRASIRARYGLPEELAPLARLRAPGITRGDLVGLLQDETEPRLYEPESILDSPDIRFKGILSASKLLRIRQAIQAEIEDSLNRKLSGHIARADQSNITRKVVEDLYIATDTHLEQAVVDALTYVGLSAQRVYRQRHGEEDVRLTHLTGTVVISVTASKEDVRPVRWNKCKEILGGGTGLNPVNYICMGRPSFDTLAERQVEEIAREAGSRSLLLVPIPVLAESILRVAEGKMSNSQLGDLLALHRGLLTVDDLPESK